MNGDFLVPETVLDQLYRAHPGRDFLVVSHTIDRELHTKVSRLIADRKKDRGCTLFLTTYGGDANGGYRLARALRNHYNHLRVVVPSFCKSAGTLITIAANEIAIGDLGELGPLDVQVRKGSELAEVNSGLDITQALQAVTEHAEEVFKRILVGMRQLGLATKVSSELAANLAGSVASPLMAQIDPMRIAEMQRAVAVAYAYGQRLDTYSSNLKDGALERLIGDYPAHGFVIDRKEAKDLFHRVSKVSSAEQAFADAAWDHLEKQGKVVALAPPQKAETAGDANEQGEPQNVGNQDNGVPPAANEGGGKEGAPNDQADEAGARLPGGALGFLIPAA